MSRGGPGSVVPITLSGARTYSVEHPRTLAGLSSNVSAAAKEIPKSVIRSSPLALMSSKSQQDRPQGDVPNTPVEINTTPQRRAPSAQALGARGADGTTGRGCLASRRAPRLPTQHYHKHLCDRCTVAGMVQQSLVKPGKARGCSSQEPARACNSFQAGLKAGFSAGPAPR